MDEGAVAIPSNKIRITSRVRDAIPDVLLPSVDFSLTLCQLDLAGYLVHRCRPPDNLLRIPDLQTEYLNLKFNDTGVFLILGYFSGVQLT